MSATLSDAARDTADRTSRKSGAYKRESRDWLSADGGVDIGQQRIDILS